jgi:NAD(P)-dependent dehydrogenase (short-subunit alcohol dehydrogenase family)
VLHEQQQEATQGLVGGVPGKEVRGCGAQLVDLLTVDLLDEGFAAAKAALNAYSRELATEVGRHGVRVVCVLPGFVATEGAVEHLQRIADQQRIGVDEVRQQIVDHLNVPMGRPGDPEDVAEMIAFLASGRAKWLTGAQFRVDGGIIPVA